MPPLTLREIAKRPLLIPLIIFLVVILADDYFRLPFFDPPPLSPGLLDQTSLLEGIVTAEPEVKKGKVKAVIDLAGGLQGKIQITLLANHSPFHQGDSIRLTGKIKKPRTYHNPGAFDYARYLSRKGIQATVFINHSSSIEVIHQKKHSFLSRTSHQLKQKIGQSIGDSPASGVLMALLWGEESALLEEVEEKFRNQGLAHLLVISGMHFAAIAWVLFYSILFLFRIYPPLYLYWPCRKIAALGVMILLTFYFLFCLPSPSLTRGYLAVMLYLAAIILNRSRDLLNILFLAALVILLFDPPALFDLSFQFSFIAVLSLILIFPWLKNKIGFLTKNRWFVQRLLDLILANLALLLGLTPLIIFYFHEFQWSGLFMNLWAIPLVELIIVPLGLLALPLVPWAFPVASLLFKIDLKLIDLVLWILDKADLYLTPPLLVFPPRGWELLVYYLLLLTFVLALNRSLKRKIITAGLLLLTIDVLGTLHEMSASDHFKITQIDVGQGDSLLIEFPGARRILVDGGGSRYFDLGENVLIPFLLHKRIPSLEAVCVTHADTDHYLGLITLLEKFPVKELWWNGVLDNSPDYLRLFEIAAARGIKMRELDKGINRPMGNSITVSVLFPGKEEKEGPKDNNRSIILKIKSPHFSALLTGDLEEFGEKRLLKAYQQHDLDVDYLKVGHHGSRTSSSIAFLSATTPKIATIGVGYKNRFRHPHPSVVERLEDFKIPFYRTDHDGAIELTIHDNWLKISPFLGKPKKIVLNR